MSQLSFSMTFLLILVLNLKIRGILFVLFYFFISISPDFT